MSKTLMFFYITNHLDVYLRGGSEIDIFMYIELLPDDGVFPESRQRLLRCGRSFMREYAPSKKSKILLLETHVGGLGVKPEEYRVTHQSQEPPIKGYDHTLTPNLFIFLYHVGVTWICTFSNIFHSQIATLV